MFRKKPGTGPLNLEILEADHRFFVERCWQVARYLFVILSVPVCKGHCRISAYLEQSLRMEKRRKKHDKHARLC